MRTNYNILDSLIKQVLDFQRKYRKPVTKIVVPNNQYKALMLELGKENMRTIYGTELKASLKAKKLILS